MKKQTKQTHKTAEEVSVELVEEREQEIDKECALEVEEALKSHNRALQPFLASGEFAIQPRVRLVRVAPENEDVQA